MKDQISALMDDELALESSEHLLTAVKTGGEASECWATYHLIGDVMRGHPSFKPGFKHQLMQKLESEPTMLAPRSKKALLKSSAMWSVAASVAAVMFVGWVVLQQQVQSSHDSTPVEVAQNVPSEYLLAHQALAPNSTAYYIQPAAYSESAK
ncbi:MAG TPA: sigma-E factor negative regulatory protein [Methylophilaceae bacterium]|jgi:sigma-E factor negative regulatory protein RseA